MTSDSSFAVSVVCILAVGFAVTMFGAVAVIAAFVGRVSNNLDFIRVEFGDSS